MDPFWEVLATWDHIWHPLSIWDHLWIGQAAVAIEDSPMLIPFRPFRSMNSWIEMYRFVPFHLRSRPWILDLLVLRDLK